MQTLKLTSNRLNSIMASKLHLILLLMFVLTTVATQVAAATNGTGGVGLNSTRLIYNQGEQSISVSARNNSSINYLAKFNVIKSANISDKSATPFSLSPPLVKIDKGTSQDIRIYMQPHSLPQDRETVFYFTATMIPSTNGPIEGAGINIGYNTIIKLFYRPKNLTISPEDARKGLIVKSTPSGVVVENNLPYYISLSKLNVGKTKIELSLQKNNTMIAPFSSFNYLVPGAKSGIATWVAINDLGGEDKYSGNIR
ncbi:molecular chaperone [Providencia vermicola]|uniref:fimbrial biogenesis chaperone n=1 Tax=Providencia vermicola TaxID=333965 RepID=UPI0034E55B70